MNRQSRTIRQIHWWQYLLLLPAALLVRLWAMSLRCEFAEQHHRRVDEAESCLFILWHNRLFAIAEIYRRYRLRRGRRIYGLVSASRDGAWLSAFFRLMGIHSIRGSSSWRARPALRELMSRLEAGYDVGITPDGPRGPCYDFKEGAALLARKGSARTFLVSANFTSAWRLKSWDGFYLPRPFSKVVVIVDEVTSSDAEAEPDALRERLLAITEDRPNR